VHFLFIDSNMAELKTDAKGKGNKVKPGCVEAHAGT
jgi:hypothetical protein